MPVAINVPELPEIYRNIQIIKARLEVPRRAKEQRIAIAHRRQTGCSAVEAELIAYQRMQFRSST